MVLSDFSIKRPTVAIVASLLLVVFGAFAAARLPIRETPNIEVPVVSIRLTYTGASAEVIESKMIKIIEDQISGIEGIKAINASARDGGGNISIEFDLDRSIDEAANDVREQVGRAVNRLPQDADPPVIQKADPDAMPILFLTVYSSTRDPMELSDYAERVIQPRLSSVPGVALANLGGQRRPSMRVWLDRRAMAARAITANDIETALRRENVELGAGALQSQDRNFTLRTMRSYQTPKDFAQIVVARGPNNYLVRLGEVATIEIGPEDDQSVSRFNGERSITIPIVKRPEASTLTVAQGVRDEVARIQPTLPEGMTFVVGTDSSVYISTALKEVVIAIGVAAVLVVTVIYLFLGTLRAAFIPAVTVPISLIGTAVVLWPLGFSINILTLLAMALAIGLVVDDAIIMVENIHRRMKEQGEPPLLAAYRGSRQVGMAVMSTTLVLVAAFVPIALMEGTAGKLFKEFSIAMAVAVTVSLFVSLTLTPVMCSKILTEKLDESAVARTAYKIFERFKAFYRRILNILLDHPQKAVAAYGLLIVATIAMFFVIPQELTPNEDRQTISVQLRAPEGSSIDYTDRQLLAVTDILRPYIESGEIVRLVQSLGGGGFGGGGTNTGQITVRAALWEDRDRSVFEILREITPKIQRVPGAQVIAAVPGGFSRDNVNNNVLTIGGPTYEDLAHWRDLMLDGLKENSRLVGVRSNFNQGKPQMRIRIDRNRAADLGVSVNTIGQTLAVMLGSRRVTTYEQDGQEYYVILQGKLDDRRTPTDVSNIYVRSDTTRELVPLTSLVNIDETTYADSLNRFNRMRSINLTLNPVPGYPLGEMIQDVEQVAHQKLPPTAQLTWRGDAQEFKDTGLRIYASFGLALVVVFLVLAAQFESFIHPPVIMVTVPLAMLGAMAGLLIFGQTINIYSQIGIIVLVGLAAKNGILIVEFANQLRDSGIEFRDALMEASLIRLRPIVMTGLATCMGAVPLAIATGAGSEGRRAIGVVVMVGVACASFITLLIIPVFYQMLARKTGSPGRVAVELAGYEQIHKGARRGQSPQPPTPGRQPAE